VQGYTYICMIAITFAVGIRCLDPAASAAWSLVFAAGTEISNTHLWMS
jgi:hypothetical protein